jgi:hypothetical protein
LIKGAGKFLRLRFGNLCNRGTGAHGIRLLGPKGFELTLSRCKITAQDLGLLTLVIEGVGKFLRLRLRSLCKSGTGVHGIRLLGSKGFDLTLSRWKVRPRRGTLATAMLVKLSRAEKSKQSQNRSDRYGSS